MSEVQPIDWQQLRDAAIKARANAYAPYSSYPVGAAGLTVTGEIVTGCNVENASYGLTLCAECSMVSDQHKNGGTKLVAVAIVDQLNQPLAPCGRCRQLLLENGLPGLLIETAAGLRTIEQLLPDAFSTRDLE
ncbi:MAG: hypothetical protein RL556_792 [Actinomycetota bacterium]|jgi:cytidine deaminase